VFFSITPRHFQGVLLVDTAVVSCYFHVLNVVCDLAVRYMQVGNAVAVPVATALGYTLGQSFLGKVILQQETLELPRYFPYCLTIPEAARV
jgi:hypothetical protein